MALLQVDNLSVTFKTADGDVQAVKNISSMLHGFPVITTAHNHADSGVGRFEFGAGHRGLMSGLCAVARVENGKVSRLF